MARRSSALFLIRDKLGDSLIAANVALAFARARPDWDVTLLIRDVYAPLVAGEAGVRVVAYRSGLQGRLLAWWWRVSGRRFDVLGVLRGFGPRTLALAQGIPACRVVVHDPRLAAVASEVTTNADAGEGHQGPALRVARAIAPDLAAPDRLDFPALAQRWRQAEKRYVVLFPVSDEPRRNLPGPAVERLLLWAERQHPGLEVKLLVRELADLDLLADCPPSLRAAATAFHDIPGLCDALAGAACFYGTDTGLLHLAAAMGMPGTAFFGPTQPARVLLPGQAAVTAVRAPVLGQLHCDVKACTLPVCLDRAVADVCGEPEPAAAVLRPDCPLVTGGREPPVQTSV